MMMMITVMVETMMPGVVGPGQGATPMGVGEGMMTMMKSINSLDMPEINIMVRMV